MSVELRTAARGIQPERFQAYLRDAARTYRDKIRHLRGVELGERDRRTARERRYS